MHIIALLRQANVLLKSYMLSAKEVIINLLRMLPIAIRPLLLCEPIESLIHKS